MKIIAYTELTENGLLLHYPSLEIKSEIKNLYERSKDKYNGYFKIDIQKPYPNRTTGQGSQNNKFYALVTEICKETGNDLTDVKDYLKERAVKRGYPYAINKLTGRIKPYSTTRVDTQQMSALIEETLQLCAELGIVVDVTEEKALGFLE